MMEAMMNLEAMQHDEGPRKAEVKGMNELEKEQWLFSAKAFVRANLS